MTTRCTPDCETKSLTILCPQIRSQETILSLLTTCRAFRDLFAPLVRRRWAFTLTAIPISELPKAPLPTGLRFTRHLEVKLDTLRNSDGVGRYDQRHVEKRNDAYGLFMVRVLRRRQTFIRSGATRPSMRTRYRADRLAFPRWIDATYDEMCTPSLILRNPEFLSSLKNVPTLRHLSVIFTRLENDDQIAACNCSIQLSSFKNLNSLELYNFFGNRAGLMEDMVYVLRERPGLKVLGLGMAYEQDFEGGTAELNDTNYFIDFIDRLCIDYGSQDKTPPLALETLRLGHGMFLSAGSIFHKERIYLNKLVRLDCLHSLHIYNGPDRYGEYDDFMQMDWEQFQGRTSLRQLSVSRFNEDVRDWLNEPENKVDELVITDLYDEDEHGLDNFYLLERGLSMLDIETRESGASTPRRPGMTILDRLDDNGHHLTRLGLYLDLESEWVGAVQDQLFSSLTLS